MLGSLSGKTVLVTGAGQGIGRAIAVRMAQQGASAVAVADRNEETAAETAELVRGAGARAEAIVCDLRLRGSIEESVARTARCFDGLDVLVNNAGVIETAFTSDRERGVDSLSEEVWDAVYEVNLKAVWLTTKFAAPHLRRSSRGPAIVNTASVSGLTGFPNAPAYGVTKAGVIHLTKVTAVDLAPVRCNCFCPGVIDTPLAQDYLAAAQDRAAMERELTAPQLVKRLGQPDEVAKLACFLASDDAAFITGASYVIDGGALAWLGVRTEDARHHC
ncbi:SDR family NAD(P)-dependent oxidoreductase [Streptomyces sp. ME02-8801-2C]|uniref:SDR family NAD(P)-dependent oxidoreductase n=1 Tax=Streptomyces sp. ME02-8801-2C TaxID=3028680 RepID=UPI0029B8AFEB|nr:SDR family NAD(P)-dependent oxidoreductase [Streptomyces sp. ME02-8801-2C]MDX3452383.1 SDR family NAD(P)-dependent oxidoreductase [Streptomyces sp. ME02-8801-2C]